MNKEQKIKLIQKSIEDKTGESCAIYEHFGGYVINWINKGGRCTDQINYEILDLLPISDPLEEQPDKGWIPVLKRKPEYNQAVIVFIENGTITVGYRTKMLTWQLFGDVLTEFEIPKDAQITHWQPLPNPPQAPVKQG